MSLLIPDAYVVYKLLNKIFGDKFITWEEETLENELSKFKHSTFEQYGKDELVTNMINALRALLSPESYVLQEWHLFEKVIGALTGKPIDFFKCQPPGSLYEIFLGMELIDDIFEDINQVPEYSDEVLLYVGLNLIDTFGVLDFPFEPYKTAIKVTLKYSNKDGTDLDVFKDYSSLMNDFLEDKSRVNLVYKTILKYPDKDVLSKIDNIQLRNIITSICSYLLVKESLQKSRDNLVAALEDNTSQVKSNEQVSQEKENDNTNEGLAEGYQEEIMSFIDAETKNDEELNNKQAARNQFVRREGTYIISDDDSNTDHTYEGGDQKSRQGAQGNSVISSQNSGQAYHKPGPSSQKIIPSKVKQDNKKQLDDLVAMFNQLDI